MQKNHSLKAINNRFKQIRHIIWDFDGTLFDTYPAIARSFHLALKDLGENLAESELRQMAKESLDLAHYVSMIISSFNVSEKKLMDAFRKQQAKVNPKTEYPFPQARDICLLIMKKSGKNFICTHRSRQSAFNLLETHKMRDLFCEFFSIEDGFHRKPDPEMFNVIIGKHNLILDEVLAVGDRELDVLAGKAAGMLTCLYGENNIETYGADLAISDYNLLYRLLSDETGE